MATGIGTEGLKVTYTDTGAKTAYKIDDSMINGLPARVGVSVQGGASDVFTFQEKLGGANGDFVDSLSSSDGVIKPITMSSMPEEFKLNITTNSSGSITLLITVGF